MSSGKPGDRTADSLLVSQHFIVHSDAFPRFSWSQDGSAFFSRCECLCVLHLPAAQHSGVSSSHGEAMACGGPRSRQTRRTPARSRRYVHTFVFAGLIPARRFKYCPLFCSEFSFHTRSQNFAWFSPRYSWHPPRRKIGTVLGHHHVLAASSWRQQMPGRDGAADARSFKQSHRADEAHLAPSLAPTSLSLAAFP